MKIAVIIPTLSRYESVIRTVKSIQRSDHKRVTIYVVVDGNNVLFNKITRYHIENGKRFGIALNSSRIGWGRSINKMLLMLDKEYDFYLSASDDLDFQPDTITQACKAMQQRFPDGDGMIGLFQTNLRHFCPGALALVGDKFINRFPDRQLYFPMYKHFCVDSELWHYAVSEKRFHLCKTAKVTHNRFQDPCHKLAQSTIKWDRVLWWMKKGRPARYWPNFTDLDFWKSKMKVKEKDLNYWYTQKQHLLGKGGVT